MKRRESELGAPKHEKGTYSILLHPSESRTYFAVRSHDLHYEIAMAISHFFLPANCVVVEKIVNICDVCQTRTKSTCLDIPSRGLHDQHDSYLGSSIYKHRLKYGNSD